MPAVRYYRGFSLLPDDAHAIFKKPPGYKSLRDYFHFLPKSISVDPVRPCANNYWARHMAQKTTQDSKNVVTTGQASYHVAYMLQ